MKINLFNNKKKDKVILSFRDKIEEYDNLMIFRLKGSIDMTTVPEIEKVWDDRMKSGLLNKNILVDFKNVKHVDSSTIAGLVKVLFDIKHEKRKLVLVNISNELRDMLAISELDNVFSIYDSEEKAIADLKG